MAEPTEGKKAPAKQQRLPGMVPKTIQEIQDAFDEYLEARSNHMEATKGITAAKDLLALLIRKHKLAFYQYQGYTAMCSQEDTFVVKRDASEKKKGEEGEDGD